MFLMVFVCNCVDVCFVIECVGGVLVVIKLFEGM